MHATADAGTDAGADACADAEPDDGSVIRANARSLASTNAVAHGIANSCADGKPNPSPHCGARTVQHRRWVCHGVVLRGGPNARRLRAVCRWPLQRIGQHLHGRRQQQRHHVRGMLSGQVRELLGQHKLCKLQCCAVHQRPHRPE